MCVFVSLSLRVFDFCVCVSVSMSMFVVALIVVRYPLHRKMKGEQFGKFIVGFFAENGFFYSACSVHHVSYRNDAHREQKYIFEIIHFTFHSTVGYRPLLQ